MSLIYPGLKVAILGLGVSGRAAVRYGLHCGAEVSVSDNRQEEQFLLEEGDFLLDKDIRWEAGGHSYEFLGKTDLILVSPGVDCELPLLKTLRNEGVDVVGELAVAAGEIPVPVIAVTGTNGKTTVTTLIGEILKTAGKRVFVGGNIGTPLYEYLLNPGDFDVLVLEVSSFQLESAGRFFPDVGVLLNISPDHLDRHGTLGKYVQTKMQLFMHQKSEHVAIVNGDDPLCSSFPAWFKSEVLSFGSGSSNAVQIGDGRLSLSLVERDENYVFNGLGPVNILTLKNYAAAILATLAMGCTVSQIEDGLNTFRPLPHRLEFVAEIAGVSYYNDSKATNTGAVIGALEQFRENVILLAGGRDKGDNYTLLRDRVGSRVKHMVVLGETADLLVEALDNVVGISRADSMEDAVMQAAEKADRGDVVLLSPACASFDMFNSYGHRGDTFKKQVLALRSTCT